MFTKYGLPTIGAALLCFAVYHVVTASQTSPGQPPLALPAKNSYQRSVAGAGIVEAQTENISVGSALSGVVHEVFVRVGQQVLPEEPLFRLDDRQWQADLKVRKANLAAAQAQLAKLEQLPRTEELPVKEARLRETQANLADQLDLLNRAKSLAKQGRTIVNDEELSRRQQAHRVAQEQVAWAQADLDLLKAGAWEADKTVSRAAVEQARAQLQQTETELERLTVRALVAGEVLQVNVRPGEFVGGAAGQALIVLGNVHRLHVRVDVDENDIPRFQPGLPARASLRGHPDRSFDLHFVRVEPYVVPKKSLTGDSRERVDTRVLQVIYALDQKDATIYVGQQVDVFIDADGARKSLASP